MKMWITATSEEVKQIIQEAYQNGFEWYKAPDVDKIAYLCSQVIREKKPDIPRWVECNTCNTLVKC
jgi:hypothetical protein